MMGGVYLSSANQELRDRGYEGVLRALYEVNPMAFIVEQAGGLAVTANGRAMEASIDELHQRSAIVLGSHEDVTVFLDEYA